MKELRKLIQAQFDKMCETETLFISEISGHDLWNTYINSFDNDPVFRDPESSVHNCNHCMNFIKRYGNIIALDENNNIMTMFDVNASDEYSNSMNNMSKLLKSSKIKDFFVEDYTTLYNLPYEKINLNQKEFKLGTSENLKQYNKSEAEKYGIVKENEIRTFNHIMVTIPTKFINKSTSSAASIIGKYRDNVNVLKRSLDEIHLDTLLLVVDLINQGSLLNSIDALKKVESFIKIKKEYNLINNKENWIWKKYNYSLARFGNELIGVFCKDLSQGVDINKACKDWNYRVDPANYMKAVAPVTNTQIKQAQKFVEENGYTESFDRRLATLDDIKASDILHINDEKTKVSIFDSIKSTSTRHKKSQFDNIEIVNINDFMEKILPNCTSVEAFFENRHINNLVTLTTSNNPESKRIMKWNNNYSWTYNGNLAGKSEIKDAVKTRGGKTDSFLRISLYFPDTENDYDLHCYEPNNNHIYYHNLRKMHKSSGMLDLDAQGIDGYQDSEKRVENLTYSNHLDMPKGQYKIVVNNYSARTLKIPFYIEIEHKGNITKLKSKSNLADSLEVLTFNNTGLDINFDINMDNVDIESSDTIVNNVYGINTQEFHKVNLMCLSPNYWESNVGNKHYFFMLNNCKVQEDIRSFHNENLISDLLEYRKVLDVLGVTQKAKFNENQLSGLGFNSTVKDTLIVKCKGSFNRMLKIQF